MASENVSRFAGENRFQVKKQELGLLKNKLTSQLSHLLEEKESFNTEIIRLNDAIRQSKEDRTFLIQSLTQSTYSDEEHRSHSVPLLPTRDEYFEQKGQGSPTPHKKPIRVLNKDEDYIERRGRKPKSLRVSIHISNVQLPKAALDNMPQNRIRDRKSIKNPLKDHIIKQKEGVSMLNISYSAPDLQTQTNNIFGILTNNSENTSFHGTDLKSTQYKYFYPKTIGKNLPYKDTRNDLNLFENGTEITTVESAHKDLPKFTPNSELSKEFEETPSTPSDK